MIKLELLPTLLLPVFFVTSCADSRSSLLNSCLKGCPIGYICTVEGTCVPNVVTTTIDSGRVKDGSTADTKALVVIDARGFAIDTASSTRSPDTSSRIVSGDTSKGGTTETDGADGPMATPVSNPPVQDSGSVVDTVVVVQPTGGSGGTGGTGGRQVDAGGGESGISTCGPGMTCSGGLECFSNQCCPPSVLGGVCNHFPACGCTGTRVCYPSLATHAMVCIAGSSLTEGADCREDNCSAGLGCVGETCKRYCNDEADCPIVGGLRSCSSATWSDDKTEIAGVKVCEHICDPVHPQNPKPPLLGCPAGFGCSSYQDGLSFCVAVKPPTGTLCESGSECPVGQYCTAGGLCNGYCFVDADCPVGKSCHLSFDPPQLAGAYQVGYCAF